MARMFQYPLLWVGPLVVLGYAILPRVIPPRVEVKKEWESGPNWFGQPIWAGLLYAIGLLVLLCVGRFLVVRYSRSIIEAVVWYSLALAVAVPATWLLVVVDWDNHAVAPIACWVGVPIALLTIPSLVFVVDLCLPRAWLTFGVYSLRSFLEIAFFVPAWCVVWVFVEFLLLGWCGV